MIRKQFQPSTATGTADKDKSLSIIWTHALAAMGDEQWIEALETFQRFLALTKTAHERHMAYLNMSACHLALVDYEQALVILDQAEAESGRDPHVLHSYAVIEACAGRINEAIKRFELLVSRHPKFAKQYHAKQALQTLRKIAQGKATVGTFLVDYLQAQVTNHIDMEEFALVEKKARRMIAADRKRSEGHFALGVALQHFERYPESLDAFMLAHSYNPYNAPTLYNIAFTHEKLADVPEAIKWYERTLKQDPKDVAALFRLGKLELQMGQRDQALARWHKALKIRPDYFPVLNSLFEAGEGEKPATEPPLPANYYERERMTPIVKQRMRAPQVFRNGGVCLTLDRQVGFVLEDEDNKRNGTIYAGGPFRVGEIKLDEEIFDMLGMFKLLLTLINASNTRDIAILVYYTNGAVFNYQAQFRQGKQTLQDVDGRFVVNEVPQLFKVRIDSDLDTPYGTPMQGMLIYLNQEKQPGKLISTLGLGKLAS